MEHCKRIAPMRTAATALLTLCLVSGCGLVMVGEPVQELDLASQDDAEENLKAVRAMLSRQISGPPDEQPSGVLVQPSASEGAPLLLPPSTGPRPVPSPSSSAGQHDVPAKLPWTPAAPERPAAQDRPVPAYTVPAPVGPDYSGSVRCTPDGMGGQRCVGR